jgi:hypothetical protein
MRYNNSWPFLDTRLTRVEKVTVNAFFLALFSAAASVIALALAIWALIVVY